MENNLVVHIEAGVSKKINFQDIQQKKKIYAWEISLHIGDFIKNYIYWWNKEIFNGNKNGFVKVF